MSAHGSAERFHPHGHGQHGAHLGIDVVELVPVERGQHLGRGTHVYRPRPEHRLVRGVLVEVDENAVAALFLPPHVGDRVRSASSQLARHCHRGAPHLDRRPAQFKEHVYTWMPRLPVVLGQPRMPNSSSSPLSFARRFAHVVEPEAGLRIEVDAQLVGVVVVHRTRGWATRGNRDSRGSPPTRCGRGRPRPALPRWCRWACSPPRSRAGGVVPSAPASGRSWSRRRRWGTAA